MLHIVLVEPEIPPNTGNIARACLATGARLHLIEPLGFSLDERQLKRAGMDYWGQCDIRVWPNWDAWIRESGVQRFFLFTTKSTTSFWDAPYADGDALVFGRETRGLPESLLAQYPERCVRIPMRKEARSLNLATSVGIGLYEAIRRVGQTTCETWK